MYHFHIRARSSSAHVLHPPYLINFSRLLLSKNCSQQLGPTCRRTWCHVYFGCRFAARDVSQCLRERQLASTSCSALWRPVVGICVHLQFSFVVAECNDAGLFAYVSFLGVCSHTLGIGDTVVMGSPVVFWLLCGDPVPMPSTFIAKSIYKITG